MSKKGENIYKRKDGRWEARYIKEYRANSAPRYGYCYAKTYREVKQKVTKARITGTSVETIPSTSENKTFAFYCDEWLKLNRSRVKQSTYVKYCGILSKHIKPSLGGYSLQSITSVLVEELSYGLLYDEDLSPKTVKDILTLLRTVIGYAAKQAPQQLSTIEVVYPKVPKKEMRVLSRDEQTRFVGYLLDDTDDYKFGVLLSLLTGMRIGEVCALRWSDVSFAERTVSIRSTMQRLQNVNGETESKTRVVISDPKSNTSARVIPLPDYAVKLCRTQWVNDPEAFVLTGERGRYVEPRTMQYRLKKYTEACGLEGVHFHTLRHTFATRCVEVDFEIKSLSEILGHSSPRVTLERYVHSSIELKRSNMNKLVFIGS